MAEEQEDFQKKLVEAQEADAAQQEPTEEEEDALQQEEEKADETEEESEVLEEEDAASEGEAVEEEEEEKPRVSMSKYQKEQEAKRKAEQQAFEANAKLNAILEAQKLAAPIAERPKEEPKNPYDPDIEPEMHEVWEVKQENAKIKAEMEDIKKGNQQTNEQNKHAQAMNLIGQTAGQALIEAQKSGAMPDAIEAYNFLEKKTKELGIPTQSYILEHVLVPIQEGRVDEIPEILKNLSTGFGYKKAKKAGRGNVEAIERNRGKSQGINKSGTASTTGSLDIKQAARKDGRGTDPVEFHKILENIQRNP